MRVYSPRKLFKASEPWQRHQFFQIFIVFRLLLFLFRCFDSDVFDVFVLKSLLHKIRLGLPLLCIFALLSLIVFSKVWLKYFGLVCF